MTHKETIQISHLQQDMRDLSDRIDPIESGLHRIEAITREIQISLAGGEYSVDGGLIKKVVKLEREADSTKKTIEEWKNKVIGIAVGVGILSGSGLYGAIKFFL